MGIIAKYDIDPDDFYFDTTLTAAQVAALPPDVNRKKGTESEKNLNQNYIYALETKRN